MNAMYCLILMLGAVATTVLFSLRLKKMGMGLSRALLTAILSAVCGLVCAKVLYFLLMLGYDWRLKGLSSLFSTDITEFSFFGACAGMMLGAALAARVVHREVRPYLDVFAPAAALMVYFARIGEYFLEEVGIRSDIETEALQRFPFAFMNEYEEWNLAVFLLEATLALIVCIIFLLKKKEDLLPGLRWERVVFYLCLPQIFSESLRSDSIVWGFVRPEQVLCAVAVTVLLVFAFRAAPQQSKWKQYGLLLPHMLFIGMMIFVEFDLDKKFLGVSLFQDYAIMLLCLTGVSILEMIATRRRLRQV